MKPKPDYSKQNKEKKISILKHQNTLEEIYKLTNQRLENKQIEKPFYY